MKHPPKSPTAASQAKAPAAGPVAPAAAAPAVREEQDLKTRTASLEMELAHKNFLLQKGFEKFIETAEKLQESQRRLQQRVGELTREVEQKNRDLERNLQEKEAVKTYLSNIFESLPIGVLVTDLGGRITSVNRAGQALFHAASPELAGAEINALLGAVLLPAPGSGELALSPAADTEEPITFRRGDGEVLRLRLSTTLMRGEQQEPLGFIFNVQDVTLLKKLEEHAERQNRFTAMGEMAANIAHEIRNPLGSIELFASLLRKSMGQDAERAALVHHISSNVASMNHIISNLLAYTKPRPVSRQRVDLHALLGEIADMFGFMAKQHQVEVLVRLIAPRTTVIGDKEQLKQVFHNLVLNSVQSMPEGGELVLATRSLSLTDPRELARFNLEDESAAAGFIEVTVQDSGCGIPKEIQKKIFDPFFSTKARGTGLGLAIVHQIILSHHATIDVESGVDQGTKMIMMFPAVKD
jgi:PAS domain S-box-containing protein